MATQHHVQAQRYLMFGLHAILILDCIGTCAHDPSFSSKVGNLSVDHQERNDSKIIGCLPCSNEYLIKSYFEKHDSLLDSDFQGFLGQEFCSIGSSCKELVCNMSSTITLPGLQRHLIGEGSHRRLVSSMKFDTQSDEISEVAARFCEIAIIERLPSGVFADPFELQHLVQRGVFADAAVFGDTNLELPSALSDRSAVEIRMNIGHNTLSRHNKGLEISVELPLHARYPPLDESGYSRVQMNAPDLLMHCRTEDHLCEECTWMFVARDGESTTGAVVWPIPCGSKAHTGVVSTVTFVSALVSALLVVLTAIYCSSQPGGDAKDLD